MSQEIIKTGEIGKAIRSRRKEIGLSQEELAEKVGVTLHQIQRYENGRTMLNVENIQRIAHVLSIPVARFFDAKRPDHIAEEETLYVATEEKNLLKWFRALPENADKKMAVQIIRRLARK